MAKRNQRQKRRKREKDRFRVKLAALFGIVLLAFAVLIGRLIWITQENGMKFQKAILSQQNYASITLPYRRGDILDAKGTKLATSERVYAMVVNPKVMQTKISGKQIYLEPTLSALETYFPQLDMAQIRAYVKNNPNAQYYVPLRQLSAAEISSFQEAVNAEDSKIRGVTFESSYIRTYPYGSLASDVIGFINSDNEGFFGLEEYYSDVLNGSYGREYGYLNDDSNLERTVKPAVDGNTIHTTIDANIQSIVERKLYDFNEQYKNNHHEGNGAENVGCIVMRVNTGEILAMASYPTFDLTDRRNTDALIGSMEVKRVDIGQYYRIEKTGNVINEELLSNMSEDEILLQLNNLWKNFCISNTYEPGSTAKPFTVAAALETGAITQNQTFECNGIMSVADHDIKCHNYLKGGCGTVTVQNSIAWSCNVALMKIGQELGKTEFARFQQIFNFGLKTNIDLAGEARTASLVYSVNDIGPADLATNSFGQNFNVTMIQMITGYCSLINGGYYYEPHIVNKITNANGATVKTIEPRILRQTVSESTSALIREYCRAVVAGEGGTGRTARPAGYAIGGKTGTAETLPRANNEYVVSFLCHAPAEDPEIAVYVVVDRPNVRDQDNARLATVIVREILTEVLPYMNIYMTEELSSAEIRELEERNLEITNRYNKTPEEDALEDEEDTTVPDPDREAVWKSYASDPATGYLIHPTTGEFLHPDTGYPVGGSAMGDSPVNPNIVNIPEE